MKERVSPRNFRNKKMLVIDNAIYSTFSNLFICMRYGPIASNDFIVLSFYNLLRYTSWTR